jgi:hypothetical protein
MIANVVVLLGLAGSTGYLFMKNRDLNAELALPADERTKRNNERLIADIKKVFQLPDEEPQVIYVNDGEKAAAENPGISSVFKDMKTGDYILLYKKARLGVQYRPSDKKVVFSSTIAVPIAVEIIGTKEAVEAAEKKLADFGNQVAITKTIKEGITQSFVYDVDDNQKDETASIAKQLGYEVGATLPSSITPGDSTEVMIFVGSTNSSQETTPQNDTTPQVP